VNHNWILAIRTDYLTSIFKLCPFLVNKYFFITVILLGIRFSKSSRFKLLFKSLFFLIPISVLINSTLKVLFGVLRPNASLDFFRNSFYQFHIVNSGY